MASSGGSGDRGAGGQVAFREEQGRLVLVAPSFQVAFSLTAKGAIVSLLHSRSGSELVYAPEAEAEGELWRIGLVSRTGARVAMSSRGSERIAHAAETDQAGNIHLSLTWTDLHAGAAHLEGSVTARFTLPRDGRAVLAELEFELPEGLSVEQVAFPRVCALGASEPSTEESVFLPLGDGLLVPDPRTLLAQTEGEAWQVEYPGPASMQLFGYTAGQATVSLSTRDISGARKTLVAAGMPRSNRLALWMAHRPVSSAPGEWRIGYHSALAVVGGDWYEAAKNYRLWAIHLPWCVRGTPREHEQPALTTYHGMWLTHWGGGRAGNESARALLRHVNVPVRLDWRQWHGEPYPDCFPARDGDTSFDLAMRDLADSGVFTQLALEGRHAHRGSASWTIGRLERAAQDEGEGEWAEMCPSAEAWQKVLHDVAEQGAKRGAEGIYVEGLAAAPPTDCRTDGHGHGGGERAQWGEGVRGLLRAVRRAVNDSYQVAADGPVETYIDLLDAFMSFHSAAERHAMWGDRFGGRWSPIPMFTCAYHEYIAHIGLGPTLTGVVGGPEELHHAAEAVSGREFSAQFCFEIARGMIWGRQLALSQFAPPQGREERNRRNLAFVAAALRAQTWGVGAVIPGSECLGLVAIEAAPIEADFLIGGVNPQRVGEGLRVVKRRLCPVLGAAWRIPGGGNAIILVNIHEHAVEFSAPLNASRIVLNLPLHLVGRVFSEDGDAPAATLHGSGTEMGGKLPARSVMLVTLY